MKTTRRPIWMRLSAVIVAIAMLMCIFAGCEKKEEKLDPLEFLKKAIENTVNTANAQVTETEIGDFAGSVEVTANLSEIEMLKEYFGDMSDIGIEAKAKMYLDTAAPAAGLNVGVSGSGMDVIDAYLFLNKSTLALQVGGLFLNEAYGINLDDFEENFDSSIFGPDGAYSIGFSYDELMDMIGEVTTALETMPEMDEELEKKAEAVLDVIPDTLLKSVDENCEVTKEDGSVKLDGTEVDTTDVIIVLDAVAAVEVLEDMMTLLRDDENIRAVMEYAFDLYSAYEFVDSAPSIDEYYDVFDEFFAEIDDMKADAAEEEIEIELAFHVSADKNELIGITMDAVNSELEEEINLELLWGPSIDEFGVISVVVNDDGEVGEGLITFDVEKTDSKYIAKINMDVKSDDEEMNMAAGVEWDKVTGAAAVYIKADGEELRAEADITTSDDMIYIALGKITVPNSDPIDLSGVYINIDKNDPIPAVGEYQDLLTMTEADFEALIETIAGLGEMFG